MKTTILRGFFTRKRILQILIYFIAAFLTIYFFPRSEKFRYHFQEGKPWKYGLLTASFDFPIYKSPEQVAHEKDSVLQFFQPYLRMNAQVKAAQVDKWRIDFENQLRYKISTTLYNRVRQALEEVYDRGIVPPGIYEVLTKERASSVMLLENNRAKSIPFSSVYSTRTAYEQVMNSIPDDYDRKLLRSYNLNNYVVQNLTLDSAVNEKVKHELVQKVAVSSGIVQAGERIVDRGEIISPQTYQILTSLESVTLKKGASQQNQTNTLAGEIIVVCGLYAFLYIFLSLFRPKYMDNTRILLFLLMMVCGTTVLSYIALSTRLLGIYLVPYAILPIVICTFLDSRTALFSCLIAVMLGAFVAPFPLEFIFLQILGGMTAMFTLRELTTRYQLVRCAIFIFCTYSIAYLGYALVIEGNWSKVNLSMFFYFGLNSILLLFAYLFIYLLEKIFGFISNVTLVELSDINNPTLRRLSESCPGTFQHSLQVSNLAAEAAIKIGANVQMVRTGALYHDIGKLGNPVFFTENQSNINPHSCLSYEQSAQIIIQHVKDGVKMADKLGLPQSVKDFISTHHGKGITKYFYNSYKNSFPDKEIDRALFAYPGPNPSTKETAILMMADSVEAASRSLPSYTEESISKLVETIISSQIADGLLKDSPISLHEIEIIKEVFIEKLKTIYHTRISYPELKNPDVPVVSKSSEILPGPDKNEELG